jgi:pimeloyl-ACP methyl ester carboxylesterase
MRLSSPFGRAPLVPKATASRIAYSDADVAGLYVRTAAPLESAPSPRPSLLFVHGAYDGWWVWKKWLEFFAGAGWRSHALSLRNHHGSRLLDASEYMSTGIADYVDDVVAVARWIEGPVALVGHSLGGFAVQKAAESLEPAALVLCASVGPGQLGSHAADFPVDELAECAADWLAQRDLALVDDAEFLDIARLFVPESPRALNDIRGRTPVSVESISCPVLAIRADGEQFAMHRAEQIAGLYGGDFLLARNTRHHVMFEGDWRATAAAIEWWLRVACREIEGLALGVGQRSVRRYLDPVMAGA